MELTSQFWLFMIPIILLQIILQIVATVNLVKSETVRGGNKVIWGFIIWCFGIIGPLVFFVAGRKD